jgi:hypothetical protein
MLCVNSSYNRSQKRSQWKKREAYLKEIWKSTRKDAGKEEERPGSQIKVS